MGMPGCFGLSFAGLALSALAPLFFQKRPGMAAAVACWGLAFSALAGSIPAVYVLFTGKGFVIGGSVLFYRQFILGLDRLSAMFILLIFTISVLSAVYGLGYFRPYYRTKNVSAAWFFFNGLVLSMAAVVAARTAIFFLVAWELMSLTSYFLVTFEHEKEENRRAGRIYLIASQAGTVFLFIFFLGLSSQLGTPRLDEFHAARMLSAPVAGLFFLSAFIGFATKAGLVPFHGWLPEAHPAAPSHVSALMSGVMIKTGIYGLLRAVEWLGVPYAWCVWLLLGSGIVSGLMGVLFALNQHRLKPLLAYHSVENIGIIVMGLGLGCLGLRCDMPVLTAFGFGGAILHVVNHAIFKGLLFLASGVILHGAGTDSMDKLGGLLKSMPWTALFFLTGAMAISGLPLFNGFVSEFLIYFGAFSGLVSGEAPPLLPLGMTICALAMIGGLALACFVKAFGISFLGSSRSRETPPIHEPGKRMLFPMAALAGLCLLIGLLAPWVVDGLRFMIGDLFPGAMPAGVFGLISAALKKVNLVLFLFIGLAAVAVLVRRRLFAGRAPAAGLTWDCGYADPQASMQYTASSFPKILNETFASVVWTREEMKRPEGIFPKHASLETHPEDTFSRGFYEPLAGACGRGFAKLRWIQHGRLNGYVLYVALTFLILLLIGLR